MRAIFRIAIFALISVAVTSCGMGANGAFYRGVIAEGYFIAADGALSEIDDFDEVGAFGDFNPHCVFIVGEEVAQAPVPRMKIRRVLLHSAYSEGGRLCHFQNERRYKALFLSSWEAGYVHTGVTPGTGSFAGDRNNLWPIVLPGWPSIRSNNPFENARCIDVRGVLSQRGIFNHMGSSTHALTITHVYNAWPVAPFAQPPAPPRPPGRVEGPDEEYAGRLEGYYKHLRELAIAACQNAS